MNVLGTVETGRTARPDAIVSKSLNGLFLQGFVGDEVVEVVACEVRDGSSVGQFRLWPSLSEQMSKWISFRS